MPRKSWPDEDKVGAASALWTALLLGAPFLALLAGSLWRLFSR